MPAETAKRLRSRGDPPERMSAPQDGAALAQFPQTGDSSAFPGEYALQNRVDASVLFRCTANPQQRMQALPAAQLAPMAQAAMRANRLEKAPRTALLRPGALLRESRTHSPFTYFCRRTYGGSMTKCNPAFRQKKEEQGMDRHHQYVVASLGTAFVLCKNHEGARAVS